jgi:hypothetical protein
LTAAFSSIEEFESEAKKKRKTQSEKIKKSEKMKKIGEIKNAIEQAKSEIRFFNLN